VGRVLVVDDDPRVADAMEHVLSAAGHEVEVALGGFEALEKINRVHPDVMLLDFRMPDLDGIDVLEELRQPDGSIPFPVLVFTSESGPRYGEVAGLRAGAIDYVRKGVDSEVIVARVDSALRRVRIASPSRRLVCGPLLIDLKAMRVTVKGRQVHLESRPYAVLVYLAEREGAVVSRNELLNDVWGTNYAGFGHAVDQAIYEVRKALGDRRWIETVSGRGYRFVARA
jgi:DNA-binding response OmpR family regulator